VIRDRGIGDDGDGELAVHTPRGERIAAMRQRVTEEPPQDERAHDHHDGDQRGDHTDTDAAPPGCYRAMAASPFAAFPFAAVLRSRRSSACGARWPPLRIVGLGLVVVGFVVVGFVVVRFVVVGFGGLLSTETPGRRFLGHAFVRRVLRIGNAMPAHLSPCTR